MYAELKRKVCKQCSEEKDLSLFRFRKCKGNGNYECYCKACEAKNNKAWMERNKEARKKADFVRNLKRFNLTEEQYFAMLDSQLGGCAICAAPRSLSGRMLAVDHDHKTGENRGLLCNECNTALGLLKENIQFFEAAIAYLRKFKK